MWLPPLKKELPICVLPSGFHTKTKPSSIKLCDMEECNLEDINVNLLICGHSYHTSCLEELDGSCSYCLSYYSDVIDKLSISFNNQLLDNNEEAENTEELDINDDSDSDNEDEINIDNKENTNIENELTQSINAFVKSFNVDLSTNNIASS